ncbi:UTP--glucose-1-phosphate uridylyltransferase GalU [Thermatribacter velox]|uniref:UTP--glucose-1-phosphate uridylyltransferase n=1 Tax=Thermatribacter velox TaxID=3039681 RepID=A0ABZ2YC20_9BACT
MPQGITKRSIKKAVIPVAGLGTRLLPATKAQPKEMLPIVDKPAVHYVVEEALRSGIESLLFVTGRGKRALEDYFDYAVELEQKLAERGDWESLELVREVAEYARIFYVRQKLPRGLGDAVLCAEHFVGDEPFAVLLADDLISAETPCLAQLMEVYRERGGAVIAVREVATEEVSSWGIVEAEEVTAEVFRVRGLVEKPDPKCAPSNLAIVGRYLLPPSIFAILKDTPPGKGGEVQLTDALERLLEEEEIWALRFRGEHFEVGSKLGYLKANIALALKRQELAPDLFKFLKAFLSDLQEGG